MRHRRTTTNSRGLRCLALGFILIAGCSAEPDAASYVDVSVSLADAADPLPSPRGDAGDAGGEPPVTEVHDSAVSEYLGGVHPRPPGDLPPVPEPPESFTGGFVSLKTTFESSPPFPLFPGDGGDIPSPTTALFGDLDGDGAQEVIVSSDRRGVPDSEGAWETVTSLALRHDPLTDSLVEDATIPLPVGHILAVVDLDGDGRDDLLTQGPSTVHWGGEPIAHSLTLEQAGGAELIGWKALGLADIDRDGLVDLIGQPVDCCSVTCPELAVVLATGRRHYKAHSELIETVNHANVCASLVAPVGDERLLMSFAAVSACGGRSHVFYREIGLDDQARPRFEAVDAAGETPTLDLSLSSPMGGSVADLDGDGDLDVTITTDAYHVVLRAEVAYPLTDITTWTGIGTDGLLLPPNPLAPDGYMIPWGAAALDLDRDGRVDLVYSHGADPNPGGDKLRVEVGPQHVSAHWNGGQMRFADVTERLGLSALGEWRALTVGDLDGDGLPDLGVGGLGEFPRVYRNAIESEGYGLALRLRGTTSNTLGLGALVRVRPRPGDPQQLHVMGHIGSPYGTSQPLIFVGLGAAEVASEVEITWPSGLVHVIAELEAGRVHTVTEPRTVEVSPWSRRLPSDGTASAFVAITARAPDGSVRSDASLSLTIIHGVGELAGPGVPDGGGMRWEIPPPGVPGETVVEAHIDGVPVTIKPRITWL
ncbi:MAG: CRTAC1 family protein [Myxococcota bacterium]